MPRPTFFMEIVEVMTVYPPSALPQPDVVIPWYTLVVVIATVTGAMTYAIKKYLPVIIRKHV